MNKRVKGLSVIINTRCPKCFASYLDPCNNGKTWIKTFHQKRWEASEQEAIDKMTKASKQIIEAKKDLASLAELKRHMSRKVKP